MADTRGADLTLPRVSAALALIFVLAIAVPYAAVRRLHERRSAAVDRQETALAGTVRPLLTRRNPAAGGVMLLSGAGAQPKALDERWTEAVPLSKMSRSTMTEPDPWGNSLLVVAIGAGAEPAGWVLSAGPDGVIQTPFPSPTLTPAGDDRIVAIR